MQSLLPVVRGKPDDVNIRRFSAYINNHTPSVRHNSDTTRAAISLQFPCDTAFTKQTIMRVTSMGITPTPSWAV